MKNVLAISLTARIMSPTRGASTRQIGLRLGTAPARSSQSNGMAQGFEKKTNGDYVEHMPKQDGGTALHDPTIAFQHYYEQHPHAALRYRSPREFRSLAAASV